MLCHTIPYHTIPYHTIPYHAMSCHAMPCHAMICYAVLCYDMIYYGMLLYAMLYYNMLCLTLCMSVSMKMHINMYLYAWCIWLVVDSMCFVQAQIASTMQHGTPGTVRSNVPDVMHVKWDDGQIDADTETDKHVGLVLRLLSSRTGRARCVSSSRSEPGRWKTTLAPRNMAM